VKINMIFFCTKKIGFSYKILVHLIIYLLFNCNINLLIVEGLHATTLLVKNEISSVKIHTGDSQDIHQVKKKNRFNSFCFKNAAQNR
jgi:hypothetical protein